MAYILKKKIHTLYVKQISESFFNVLDMVLNHCDQIVLIMKVLHGDLMLICITLLASIRIEDNATFSIL